MLKGLHGIKKRSSAIIIGFLIVAFGIVLWLLVPPLDRQFRGRLESDWIQNLAYRDEQQVKQWREFGPEGVQVLIRGWHRANRPLESAYRRIYRRAAAKWPYRASQLLPAPPRDSTRRTRVHIVSLLASLGNDAKPAMPIMTAALRDEDSGVRSMTIPFFTAGEDENAPLNKIPKRQKEKLLSEFITLLKDDNWAVRNNALVALRYYPEYKEIVAPALTQALNDPMPKVRHLAADTLKMLGFPKPVVAEGK